MKILLLVPIIVFGMVGGGCVTTTPGDNYTPQVYEREKNAITTLESNFPKGTVSKYNKFEDITIVTLKKKLSHPARMLFGLNADISVSSLLSQR